MWFGNTDRIERRDYDRLYTADEFSRLTTDFPDNLPTEVRPMKDVIFSWLGRLFLGKSPNTSIAGLLAGASAILFILSLYFDGIAPTDADKAAFWAGMTKLFGSVSQLLLSGSILAVGRTAQDERPGR